jgi:hypothetical protein
MPGEIFLSTAYFPPAEYFSLIRNAGKILIEQEEHYIRQTYRNRCKILASNGIQVLTVPVAKGSLIKAPVKDVTIDYSKRWQQVHIRALIASYSRSPYFQFYFEQIEKILLKNHRFLLSLNDELLHKCLEILKINKYVLHTYSFKTPNGTDQDYRYGISLKEISGYNCRPYIQVFGQNEFIPGLSILDLIFNMGPEAVHYL